MTAPFVFFVSANKNTGEVEHLYFLLSCLISIAIIDIGSVDLLLKANVNIRESIRLIS